MVIRKATIDDCMEMTKLRLEMRQERENTSQALQQVFIDNTVDFFNKNSISGHFIAYVAVENSEIIATSGLCFYTVPPTFQNMNGKVAYIMNMYTKPSYRKKGIASQLLDCVVKEAKDRNCTKITLNASDMGKSLYLKYGFKDIQNDMEYTVL